MLGANGERQGAQRKLRFYAFFFFRAFSGRFSKYSFRKTLLHSQKVNSQPEAQSLFHTGKNIERFVKRLTTALQKMWFAGCTV